jgi:hypothetical protein
VGPETIFSEPLLAECSNSHLKRSKEEVIQGLNPMRAIWREVQLIHSISHGLCNGLMLSMDAQIVSEEGHLLLGVAEEALMI